VRAVRAVVALLASVSVFVGGCSSGRAPARSVGAPASPSAPSSSTSEPRATATSGNSARASATARAGVTITVDPSPYGPVLFDRSGQAIYAFDAETGSLPRCYDRCAQVWPPVLTMGTPVASHGVRPDLLGVTSRTDGQHQVTYRGRPLYFYAREGKHQVLCHNVDEFGGRWLALTTAGVPAPA